MDKHKVSYTTTTYKRILVQLLLSILLFANCEWLDLSPNFVDLQPPQEEIQRETVALDEQEDRGLVQQAQTGFSNLPIELQAYILSLLGGKDFHRASLVCQGWRAAVFIAGEEKTLDLSGKKLYEKDCQVLLEVPFFSLLLEECRLGDQEMRVLSQSRRIKHLNLYSGLYSDHRNNIGAAGAQAIASGNLVALTSLNLGNNWIRDAGVQALASGNLATLTSLDFFDNKMEEEGKKTLRAWAKKKFIKLNF